MNSGRENTYWGAIPGEAKEYMGQDCTVGAARPGCAVNGAEASSRESLRARWPFTGSGAGWRWFDPVSLLYSVTGRKPLEKSMNLT